jgi:uncharacterized membrane protein
MDTKSSVPLRDLPPKERRHRKVAYAVIIVSSLLLMLALLCLIISLHFSSIAGRAVDFVSMLACIWIFKWNGN